MLNKRIADILEEIADLYEMQGVEFKPRAYRNAARTLESMSEDIQDVVRKGDIEDLPGVGKSIAKKIREYLKTGKIGRLEELRKDAPREVEKLTAVEGVGPKRIKRLHDAIGIKDLDDLRKAAKEGDIEEVEGFGKKTQKKILENIAFAERSGERYLLGHVMDEANDVVSVLEKEAKRLVIAGSLRRKKETIGDVDILAVTEDASRLADEFTSMSAVDEVISKGEKKSSVRLNSGIRVDLRMIADESFGSALMYFTGSKQHNIALRRIAQDNNWKLNEYGLFENNSRIAGVTEEEVYRAMGIQWIPPEMRENRGEVELAINGEIPDLVRREDVISDLQMHTTESDGKDTLETMARKCRELGHEYMAVTDHGGGLRIANALGLDRIREQRKEIHRLNQEIDGFTILQGIEGNIDRKGNIDVEDDVIREVDLVLGSVHSAFRMEKKEMTERVVNAIGSGKFRILAHPTGRKIMDRKPMEMDMDRVLEAARDAGVVMEINAYPERLDLNDINVRKAREAGVKLSIGTDAHMKDHLSFVDLGVYTARRGWARKEDIINTLPLKELKKILSEGY